MKSFPALGLLALGVNAFALSPLELLLDLNLDGDGGGSFPHEMVSFGDVSIFLAHSPEAGVELWKSDGTEAGTTILKDIVVGPESGYIGHLTSVEGAFFFAAGPSPEEADLWVSDGTRSGTRVLMEFDSERAVSVSNLTAAGSQVYFTVGDWVNSTELWVSDGTEEGTVLIKNLAPNAESDAYLRELVYVGEELFFDLNSPTDKSGLWKSNGTSEGTVRLMEITPSDLTNVAGTLFFAANTLESGTELWKSDGTREGTVQVKDIRPGSSSSFPNSLTTFAGELFFSARSGALVSELWRSDGTEEGTNLVRVIGETSGFIHQMKAAGGQLFLKATVDEFGTELWKSDGTEAGTRLVKDIIPGRAGGLASIQLPDFAVAEDLLYFKAQSRASGVELWRSDGTEAGTYIVEEIGPGKAHGLRETWDLDLVSVNDQILFSASTPENGNELWKTSRVEKGAAQVKNIFSMTRGSDPRGFSKVGDHTFFTAEIPEIGRQIWRTDGTEEGTASVSDVYVANTFYVSQPFVDLEGIAYFAGADEYGSELWRSDGTEEGTFLLKDIILGEGASLPRELTGVAGSLFFTAVSSNQSLRELWKSDGTEQGTVRVLNVPKGARDLVSMGGELYFSAITGDYGEELWKTDGGDMGTTLVRDLVAGAEGGAPRMLTAAGDTLFFVSKNQRELWKSDGSEEGTRPFIAEGDGGLTFHEMIGIGENLYFTALNQGEWELWMTDGTAHGTFLLREGSLESASFSPYDLRDFNGHLFFLVGDEDGTQSVWQSDGTAEGTVQVSRVGISLNNLEQLSPNMGIVRNSTLQYGLEPFVFEIALSDLGVSAVNQSQATVNGSVNTGMFSSAYIEYGIDTGYGMSELIRLNPNGSAAWQEVSITLEALSPGTTFHYRFVGYTAEGIVTTDDNTFTTMGEAPPKSETWQRPNFEIRSISFNQRPKEPGQPFSLSLTVQNTGNSWGNAGMLRIWADHGAWGFPEGKEDRYDLQIPVGVLQIGESKSFELENSFIAPVDSGTYYVMAYVDIHDSTEEWSTRDNLNGMVYRIESVSGHNSDSKLHSVVDSDASFTSVSNPDLESDSRLELSGLKPDFAVQSVTIEPIPTESEASFDAMVRVFNGGDVPGDAGILAVWTANPSHAPDPDSAPDVTVEVGTIEIGEGREIRISDLVAPETAGTYHTVAVINYAGDRSLEKLSENNYSGATYTLHLLPSALTSAESLGAGWFHSAWFGYFASVLEDWVFSQNFGFVYVEPAGEAGSVWFYSPELQTWLLGGSDFDRFYYNEVDDSWIWVFPREDQTGAWLLNMETGNWELLEP